MKITKSRGLIPLLRFRSILKDKIKAAQSQDSNLLKLIKKFYGGKFTDFIPNNEGALQISGRLCVPNMDNLRDEILEEAHYAAYSILLSSTKIYHNIKDIYWWDRIKKDVVELIFNCLTCQQLKVEHQKPSGKL